MKYLLILLIFISTIPTVSAQNEPPEPTCTLEDVSFAIEEWQIFAQQVTAITPGVNMRDVTISEIYWIFVEFDRLNDTIRQMCNPLHWENSGQIVLDPVFIEAGVYRLIITGERNDSVGGEVLSGSCDTPFVWIQGEGNTEAAEIFRSEDCLILLEVESEKSWTVTFEKVA